MMDARTKELILRKHEQGFTPAEIAKANQLPLQLVRAVIRASKPGPTPSARPEFIEPPLFDEPGI